MTVSSRIATYLVAGAIAAALLFYVFGQISALLGVHDAQITAASHAQLELHAGLARQRQKLAAVERQHAATVARDRTVADSLRRMLATGARVDTVPVLIEIATRDSSAARGCSLIVLACQQRAASAEAEVDSLHRRLTNQVTVHDRRCGLFAGIGPGAGWVASPTGSGLGVSASLTVAVGCRLWP